LQVTIYYSIKTVFRGYKAESGRVTAPVHTEAEFRAAVFPASFLRNAKEGPG